MNIISLPTREAWLAARQVDPTSISATEATQILGLSPYGGPWDLFAKKRGLVPDAPQSAQQTRGHRWERRVLEDYAEASGVSLVEPVPRPGLAILQSDKHPWLRCSPDSFASHKDILGGAEAKTDSHTSRWTPEAGTVIERWENGCETLVPPAYAVQVYLSLEISGFDWWDLCALVPASRWVEVRWVRILRDRSTQDSLVEAIRVWREKHLVGGEPPEITGDDACNLYLSTPIADPRPERLATEVEAREIARYHQIGREIESLKVDRDTLKNRLIASAGGHRLKLGDDKKAPYAQPQYQSGRPGLDTEKLKTDFPAAWEACQKKGLPFTSFNCYRMEK